MLYACIISIADPISCSGDFISLYLFRAQNPEFGLLRKMEVGFSNLSTLLREVERLGAEFWTSTLPANGGDVSKDHSDKSIDKSNDKSKVR